MTFTELQAEHGKRNVFKDEDGIVICLSNDVVYNYDDVEEMDKELLPYVVEVDYKWEIGMGDDLPNALIIKTNTMLDNKAVLSFIDSNVG